MDLNRFTEKLQEAMQAAQSLAASRGQQQLDVDHLLIAFWSSKVAWPLLSY